MLETNSLKSSTIKTQLNVDRSIGIYYLQFHGFNMCWSMPEVVIEAGSVM